MPAGKLPPVNGVALADGRLALLDLGSVGRLDARLRASLQELLLAIGRGDPAALCDALLDLLTRPEQIDEQQLERALGQFMAVYFAGGTAPAADMFADLVRLITRFGLPIPAEIATVFRALGTLVGAAAGIVAAVLLTITSGPKVTPSISLLQVIGGNLLIAASILVLQVLFTIFRSQ